MDSCTTNGIKANFLHHKSGLLNDEERGWVEEALQHCEIMHAVGIARLYTADPRKRQWEYTGAYGAAAVVTESNLQNVPSHYIRIIDLKAWNPHNALLFEQEFYNGFQILCPRGYPFFHVFEMNEGLGALSFACNKEAEVFFRAVRYCARTEPKQVIAEQGFVMSRVRQAVENTAISVPSMAMSSTHSEKISLMPTNQKKKKGGKFR